MELTTSNLELSKTNSEVVLNKFWKWKVKSRCFSTGVVEQRSSVIDPTSLEAGKVSGTAGIESTRSCRGISRALVCCTGLGMFVNFVNLELSNLVHCVINCQLLCKKHDKYVVHCCARWSRSLVPGPPIPTLETRLLRMGVADKCVLPKVGRSWHRRHTRTFCQQKRRRIWKARMLWLEFGGPYQ